VNHPVVVGAVLVTPGDLVLGDDDGVTVVPRERAPEVLERARDRAVFEANLIEQIRAGKTTLELLGLGTVLKARGIVEA
jgi:4-hydroxy-4-methyl-2-oxoglutarate aldolase